MPFMRQCMEWTTLLSVCVRVCDYLIDVLNLLINNNFSKSAKRKQFWCLLHRFGPTHSVRP